MKLIDFRNAFVVSSSNIDGKPTNTCRSRIQARCTLTHVPSVDVESYDLCQACIGEHMYLEGQITQVPTSEIAIVFNRHESMLMKKFADQHSDLSQITPHGRKQKLFDGRYATNDQPQFMVPMVSARKLESPDQIVSATLNSEPLAARTSITSPDNSWEAVVEYPVDYMNVHPPTGSFSVDVGPIVFPDFRLKADPPISMLRMAYILYKTLDHAELVFRAPTKLSAGATTQHYDEVIHLDAASKLFRLG